MHVDKCIGVAGAHGGQRCRQILRSGITGGCGLPTVGFESQSLKEQHAPLTTEQPYQPVYIFFLLVLSHGVEPTCS